MDNLSLNEHGGRAAATRIRVYTIIACASIVGPGVFVALLAAGLAKGVAIAATAALVLVAALLARGSLPTGLAGAGNGPRALFAVFLLLCGAAAYRLGHMSVYMLDAENKDFVLNPAGRELPDEELNKPFFLKHNCFTGSVIAAHLASEGFENIYSRKRYRDAETPTPIHDTIGDVLTVDQFQYPPPFLVLPKALMMFGHDFFQIRTIWFGINVVAFCFTAFAYANWLGGPRFSAYWLSVPLVLLATTTLTAIEIGNAHFLIITMSLLGALLLERRRYAIGGALLGYCVVGKIFPGVLLAYLVFARRWKAVVATGIAMIAYVLATLALFGMKPFTAFVEHQMPMLASGEAFSFAFEMIGPLTVNLSVMGIPYRLDKLGLLGGLDPAMVAPVLVWVYTLVLCVAIAIAGLRTARVCGAGDDVKTVGPNRRHLVLVWFALLALGQMRNPFLPWGYGNLINLWLISLLLAMTGGSIVRIAPLLLMWVMCFFVVPLPFGPPTVMFDLAYVLVVVMIILLLCLVLALRAPPAATAAE
jgi:hypothetical protein